MEGIIIILGSPNDEKGNLSAIAISKADLAVEQYRTMRGYKLLCTGGWGCHFNNTNMPHCEYVASYLIAKGIPKEDILPERVLSANTIDDACLAKPVVDKYGVTRIIMITADFHMARARYIFEGEFAGYNITFLESYPVLPAAQLEELVRHEDEALDKLKRQAQSQK